MRLVYDVEDEVLNWLNVAKRILGGEISPDEALEALKLDAPCPPRPKRVKETSRPERCR